MKFSFSKTGLFILAIVFTIGLTFASQELPYILDGWIQSSVNFPGFDQQSADLHINKTELYFQHLHLRTLGYFGLGAILLLIIIGFSTNSRNISLIGAFALFLPIFGHFALTMFFLAGLGFLRFLWIPFSDISPIFMKLGDIFLLPYNVVIHLGDRFHLDLRLIFPVVLIGLGVLLFVFGVYVWFTTKYEKGKVANSWIYRVSRHPQYLGWIIWSYGLFLLPAPNIKRSWGYDDTLPWLLSTMIILAISLLEELKMEKRFGQEYASFKHKTSFMFPIPYFLKKIIKHPLKLFLGKISIDGKKDVLIFTGYYTLLLMMASYLYLAFTDPSVNNFLLTSKREARVMELASTLENSTDRRTRDLAAMDLERYGQMACDPLLKLISSTDDHARNYAIRSLTRINHCNVCDQLSERFNKDSLPLSPEVLHAIGTLKCIETADKLIQVLYDQSSPWKAKVAITLSKIGEKRAIPFLLDDFPENDLFTQIAYVEALGNLKAKEATFLIIEQLENNNQQMQEAAIVALTKIKPEKAIEPLTKLAQNNNWEIRIYATEAIHIIRN